MPLNETVGSGSWSNSDIWSLGRTPVSSDDVRINSDHTVVVDVTDIQVQSLRVLGSLLFPTEFPAGGLGYSVTVNQNTTSPSTGFIDYQPITSPENKHLPFVFLKCINGKWDLSALSGLFDNFHDVFPLTKHGYWVSLTPEEGGWFGIVSSVQTDGTTTLTVDLPSDAVSDNYFRTISLLSGGSVAVPVCVSPPTTIKPATIQFNGTNYTVTINERVEGVTVGSVVFPIPFIPVVLENITFEPRPDGLYQIGGECTLTSPSVWSISCWGGRMTNPTARGNLLFLFGKCSNSWDFERGVVIVSRETFDSYEVVKVGRCWVGGTKLPRGAIHSTEISTLSDLEMEVSDTSLRVGKWTGKLKLTNPPSGKISTFTGELNPLSTLNTHFTIGNEKTTSFISDLPFNDFFSQHKTASSAGTLTLINSTFENETIPHIIMNSNGYIKKGGTAELDGVDFPSAECLIVGGSTLTFTFPTTKPYFGLGTNQLNDGKMLLVGKGISVVRWTNQLNWYFVETDGELTLVVRNDTQNDISLPIINPKEFGENEVPPWGVETSDETSPLLGLFVGAPCNETENPFIVVDSPFKVIATKGKGVGSEVSISVTSSDNRTIITTSLPKDEYLWFGYLNPDGKEKIELPTSGKVIVDVFALTKNYYPNYERMANLFSMDGFDGVHPDFSVLPLEGYIVYVMGSVALLAFAANFIALQQNQLSNEKVQITPRLSPKIHLPRYISTFLRELIPTYPYDVVILPDDNKIYVQIFCVTSEPTLSEMNTISTGLKRLMALLNKVHPPSSNWTIQYFVVHRYP